MGGVWYPWREESAISGGERAPIWLTYVHLHVILSLGVSATCNLDPSNHITAITNYPCDATKFPTSLHHMLLININYKGVNTTSTSGSCGRPKLNLGAPNATRSVRSGPTSRSVACGWWGNSPAAYRQLSKTAAQTRRVARSRRVLQTTSARGAFAAKPQGLRLAPPPPSTSTPPKKLKLLSTRLRGSSLFAAYYSSPGDTEAASTIEKELFSLRGLLINLLTEPHQGEHDFKYGFTWLTPFGKYEDGTFYVSMIERKLGF
ncbi:hypothetical protein BZA05DRAFT_421292 [Tricharina praecox]|uniref:uncharacterized protein n=1 Tax=Tricharina praecox TaxID=43433 RepID=UPI002220E457|nr:uncharacterized protein BZA05DRAFT_421292 [Tricharina praecox]KAI5845468.1 hypothetical protein BZA05DRAFT_421292 [Tricharina praecox]